MTGGKTGRFLMTIILAFVLVYVLLSLALYVFQSRLLYFPEKAINQTPYSIGLRFEAEGFRASDGVELSGWFVPVETPKAVVLLCHGNAGNISHRLEMIRILHEIGLSTFIFDYRGYGASGGSPSEEGTYKDAEAAWKHLTEGRGVDPRSVVVFGESLGGPIAAWLAQGRNPGGLVIHSSFTSVPELAAQLYPFFPVRILVRFRYGTEEYLSRVRCPVLVIHSRNDELAPYAHGQKLYNAVKGEKKFLEIGGDHNSGFIVSEETFKAGLSSFVSDYISKAGESAPSDEKE